MRIEIKGTNALIILMNLEAYVEGFAKIKTGQCWINTPLGQIIVKHSK